MAEKVVQNFSQINFPTDKELPHSAAVLLQTHGQALENSVGGQGEYKQDGTVELKKVLCNYLLVKKSLRAPPFLWQPTGKA